MENINTLLNLADILWRTSQRVLPNGSFRAKIFRSLARTVHNHYLNNTDPKLTILEAHLKHNLSRRSIARQEIERNPGKVKSILLIKADHIGDFVIGVPAFQLLRSTFTQAQITLLCGKWNVDLAKQSGLFDKVIPVNFFPEVSQDCADASNNLPNDTQDILKNLPYYDIAIDLKVEDETRFLLYQINAGYKAGFESSYSPIDITFELPRPHLKGWDRLDQEHHTRRLLYMLASGVVADYQSSATVYNTLATIGRASDLPADFPAKGRLIGINIGAGADIKKWPIERYAALADHLADDFQATIILFGSNNEKGETMQMLSLMRTKNFINYTGKISLLEFTTMLQRLDLYVGNDTGTTHLAAGMHIPTLCLFSGGGPIGRFAPIGAKLVTLYQEVPCAPCGIKKTKNCSFGHYCMRGISVDYVRQQAEKMLGMNMAA